MGLTTEDKKWIMDALTTIKESLEQEINDFRSDLTGRFDAQAARLERHAALWQTGSRWSARMDAWAEKIDAGQDATQKALAELRERLTALERLNEGKKQ